MLDAAALAQLLAQSDAGAAMILLDDRLRAIGASEAGAAPHPGPPPYPGQPLDWHGSTLERRVGRAVSQIGGGSEPSRRRRWRSGALDLVALNWTPRLVTRALLTLSFASR